MQNIQNKIFKYWSIVNGQWSNVSSSALRLKKGFTRTLTVVSWFVCLVTKAINPAYSFYRKINSFVWRNHTTQRPRLVSGFTALEVIIVISIVIVVSTLGMSAFSSFQKGTDLSAEADRVITLLVEARSKTLSAENALQHGVHFESDKIVSFSGATYSSGDSRNQEVFLSSIVEISTTTLNGGGSDVVFKKLSGDTQNDGTIVMRLKSDTSRTKAILIRETGLAVVQ